MEETAKECQELYTHWRCRLSRTKEKKQIYEQFEIKLCRMWSKFHTTFEYGKRYIIFIYLNIDLMLMGHAINETKSIEILPYNIFRFHAGLNRIKI